MTGEITARLGGSLTGSWFRRAALGSCLACALLASLASTAGAVVFTNTAPISIPALGNASPYPSPIVVAGLPGTITDVNVTLSNYSHTDAEDVAVVLVPPSGTNILLMDGPGGTDTVSNVNITFDDQVAGVMPQSMAFPSGSYKPTSYFAGDSFPAPGPLTNYCYPGPVGTAPFCTLASTLNGKNPNGTWNLYVIDLENPDSGTIAGGWSVDILSAVQPPRTLTVSRNGTGNGTVTGTGLDCGADCSEAYAGGLSVPLTATPAAGSTFAGWAGCDNPSGSTCTMSMTADKAVIATFTAAAQPTPPTPTPAPGVAPSAAPAVPAQSPDTGLVNCATTLTVATNGTAKLCDAANPPTASTAQSLTGTLPTAKAAAKRKARPRTRALGAGQTTVPPGQTRPVEVKLTSAAMRALKKKGKLKAEAIIEARGNDGQTATVKRALTFKPAKKPRKRRKK